DADLDGDLAGLVNGGGDLTVAAFAERVGGGFGITKRVARDLIEVLGGVPTREPLSGQRSLSSAARASCFPVAAGFGCEVRMTIDAARAGLELREVELPLRHRPTGRDARGFLHRAQQLRDAVYACGPLGARPGRALQAYLVAALVLDAPVGIAVLLLPYDLREMAMLGDAGSNALGGLVGLKSVERFTGRGRWVAIGALAGLTFLGERTSIGAWIERTPGVAWIDRLGRAWARARV